MHRRERRKTESHIRMPQKHMGSKAEYTKSMDTRKKRRKYYVKSSNGQKEKS
mgnify:CR=1 FL=1